MVDNVEALMDCSKLIERGKGSGYLPMPINVR